MGEVIGAGIAQSDAILLGRCTYLEVAELWPSQGSGEPMADFMNNTPKHIMSSTLKTPLESRTRGVEDPAHRRAVRDVPAGERVARA